MTAPLTDLDPAYKGSYYTIPGAGGDLAEWTTGYEDLLAKENIGKPTVWYTTTGAAVNSYAGEGVAARDQFPSDLTFLLFPLDGLNAGKLAMLKLAMADRWFDDIIDNMRREVAESLAPWA